MGLENLPKDRPVILVANHQNAMLDPVLACVFLPRQLHWLTRADVFKHPIAKRLLTKFNMLPVYRERDRVSNLHEVNSITFNEAYARLRAGAVICVFPEGTHRGKKQLFPLKKGVARMTSGALDNGVEQLCIVPVGFDYEDYYSYRRELIIQVGKPLEPSSIEPGNTEDPIKFQNKLITNIRESLVELMIDIEDEELYDMLIWMRHLSAEASGTKRAIEQYKYYHRVCEVAQSNQPFRQSLIHLWKQISTLDSSSSNPFTQLKPRPHSYSMALLVLLAIPSLIGIALFYPVYWLAEKAQKSLVKDPLFINSIRLVVWTFFPLIWIAAILILGSTLTGDLAIGIIAAVCSTICGVIALNWQSIREKFLLSQEHDKLSRQNNSSYNKWTALCSQVVKEIKSHVK